MFNTGSVIKLLTSQCCALNFMPFRISGFPISGSADFPAPDGSRFLQLRFYFVLSPFFSFGAISYNAFCFSSN